MMEPEPGNPHEIEGVLNPAAVRGPDGNLYLFPRLVAKGNYSRIGIARVRFNAAGDPAGVERLGIALEPEADYELRPNGGGGCEDPRITFVEPLKRYLMTYAAFSARGSPDRPGNIGGSVPLETYRARDASARIRGLNSTMWTTKMPACFRSPFRIRPVIRKWPFCTGRFSPALVQRKPPATWRRRDVDLERESIWISYCPMMLDGCEPHCFGKFAYHHRLAAPVSRWERLKIGAGTPPILTRHGWLIVYHGVCEMAQASKGTHPLRYSAGVMVLSKEHPQLIRYRSADPVLTPSLPQERDGTVANVVFPTGIDRRDDIGSPDRFDIYYGMADSRIGVARLDVPEFLPPGGIADPPEAKV